MYKLPGAYIWRGLLQPSFLRFEFRGLIFYYTEGLIYRGGNIRRGLYTEGAIFRGAHIRRGLYSVGAHFRNFTVVYVRGDAKTKAREEATMIYNEKQLENK